MSASGGLEEWAERFSGCRPGFPPRGRQREQEFFDTGQSRSVAWGRRPQAAALLAQLADLGRGWEAVVIWEYERAFYGSQYALVAPLLEHYGCSYGCRRLEAWSTTPRSMT